MPKPVCTVMVGLPAAGKSTLVHEVLETYPDAFVYSIDEVIERCAAQNNFTYDQAWPEFAAYATKLMNEKLAIAIRSKQDIIWDQTNLGLKKRRRIINRVKQAGYTVVCESIAPPKTVEDIAEWNRRLHSREGKTLPEPVIHDMVQRYVAPTAEEGFDMITFYNMHGVLINTEYGEK